MNSNCIGVFDSGLGGLTCLKEIMNILPLESTVYFGDTARLPYGGRTKDELMAFAKSDINFLKSHNPKVIVVACGTVSSVVLPVMNDVGVPVFGVIDAAAKASVNATKNKKIGIIATEASVRSGAYEKKIKSINPNMKTIASGCPLFVPLVESGKANTDEALKAAREYLAPIVAEGVDTLILGCTHYPMLSDVIREVVGDGVTLIDPGRATAVRVKEFLEENNLLGDVCENKFFVSGEPESFRLLAGEFLEKEIKSEVQKIDIEKYM